MEFLINQQVGVNLLTTLEFDLFITAEGHEKRCTHILDRYKIIANKKIALSAPIKGKKIYRRKNFRLLKEGNFQVIKLSGFKSDELTKYLADFLNNCQSREPRILIDYSCMTKRWYSSIINNIQESEFSFDSVHLYFVYSPARYSKPGKVRNIKRLEDDLSRVKTSHDKPVALIVALGTETGRVEHIIKMIKPDMLILMFADPAFDAAYVESVYKNNRHTIDQAEPRNVINYPLKDIDKMNDMITTRCLELRVKYNVIIAPLGPKIFTLNAYLLTTRYPDIMILDTNAGLSENLYKTEPMGEILLQKATFVSDEEQE